MQVKFVDFGAQYLAHKDEYDEAIQRPLTQGKLVLQDDLEQFEENLAKFLGMKYALGVANGTDALLLAITAKFHHFPAIVDVTDYTFKATHEAIFHAGLTPSRVDINPNTRMPDAEVYVPVHIEGMISHSNHALVEDACQAIGAKGVGYSGTACYSFYPAKILGCFGDGGAVATNSKEEYELIKLMRHHYQTNTDEMYAWNSRLDNVQASFLNVKLKYLPEILKRREEIANMYAQLEGFVKLPLYQEGRVWQDYVIETNKAPELVEFLKGKGIQTLGQGMTPPHVAMNCTTSLPNVKRLYKNMLRLPCNETLTNEQVEYTIAMIKDFFNNHVI